jgi:cystathionine beta-lyase
MLTNGYKRFMMDGRYHVPYLPEEKMNKNEMTPSMIVTHYGENPEDQFGAVVPPIYQNSLNVYPNLECYLKGGDEKHPYVYMRSGNPTIRLAEEKIAALEGADDALCFASGMAAISSATLACVKSGDHIVAVRNCYGPQYGFMSNYLARFGVTVTFVAGDSVEDFVEATQKNTTLYYLESPTSFNFRLQDLSAIAQFARAKGIFTLIDNSWASPIYQNPITLGIDAVLHSASKYLGGHSDIVAGVLCGSQEFIQRVRNQERSLLGGILHPQQAFLLTRGLRTLPLRMKNHMENTLAVAQFLEQHKKVRVVHYPGLSSHPQYELGKRQMSGYSGLMSFELKRDDRQTIIDFVDRLEWFQIGCSWGGHESLALAPLLNSSPESLKAIGVSGGLIRMSIGHEGADALIADLAASLEKVPE